MAKKEKKKSGIAESFEPRLLAATASNALEMLEEVGDKGPALVEAWVRESNALAVHAIAWADDAPALARKTARRGLNILKSRGVPLPEKNKKPEPAPQPASFEAWYLAPDQSGVSVFTIGSHSAGQNFDIVDVQIHENAGVIDVRVGEATRSGIRSAFRNIESSRGYAPVPVPVEWARWHIEQAKKRNATSGLIMPLGFDTSANLLKPVPEQEPVHPIERENISLDDTEIQSRISGSSTLHNDPEFRSWLPEMEFINELLGKIGHRIGPDPGQQQQEQITAVFNEEVAAATDRFFTPDVRQRLAERLRDAAISVHARAGRERTLDVLATAEAAKRAGLITSPPSEIPFLKDFFNKALALVAASQGGKLNIPIAAPPTEQQGLVAPPEVFEEAAKTRAGRTDSDAESGSASE